MPSKYLKGIRRTADEEVFPASPTLINELDIPEEQKIAYLEARKTLLSAKTKDVLIDKRLRPYQNQDVLFLTQLSKGKLVFNQQRTGKTPTTLITMLQKQQFKNIIVTPKSNVLTWFQEYKYWMNDDVIYIKQSWNKERRIKAYKTLGTRTLILNHDKIELDFKEILKYCKHFDAIVLDEAQILRTYTSSITKTREDGTKYTKSALVSINLNKIRRICDDAYALTGTPIDKLSELFGILHFIFHDLFTSYYSMMDYYFTKDIQYFGEKSFTKYGDFKSENKKKELLEFIETFSVQRKRKDIMQWLPPVDEEYIYLETPEEMIRASNELSNYFEYGPIDCPNSLTVMLRQRQLTIHPKHFKIDIASPKFEWIQNHVQDFPDTPMLILGTFTEILKELKDTLPKTVRMMSGESSQTQRKELEDDFQNGKFKVLIAHIEVIALGMTFSKAEEIIVLDPSLIWLMNAQAYDRFLPVTEKEAEQKNGQRLIHLINPNTIDDYIKAMLERKAEEADIVGDYCKHLKRMSR